MTAAHQLEAVSNVIASDLMKQIKRSEQGTAEQQSLLADVVKSMEEIKGVVSDVSKNIANTAEASANTRHNATDGAQVVQDL